MNIYKNLKHEGIFIFDFWYGPAVLTQRPEVRVKRLEDSVNKIIRIAEPRLHPNKNFVDANYEVVIVGKKTKSVVAIGKKL